MGTCFQVHMKTGLPILVKPVKKRFLVKENK